MKKFNWDSTYESYSKGAINEEGMKERMREGCLLYMVYHAYLSAAGGEKEILFKPSSKVVGRNRDRGGEKEKEKEKKGKKVKGKGKGKEKEKEKENNCVEMCLGLVLKDLAAEDREDREDLRQPMDMDMDMEMETN